MGADLHDLTREIALASQPRLVALLGRIKKHLAADPNTDWAHLIAEIDRELQNASIR